MFVRFAVRVRSAWHVVAGIDAFSLDTGKVIFTLVVARTFQTRRKCSGASGTVRIAGHAVRTFANVAAVVVDTISVASARIVRTFVYVHATVLGIALVADFAHTLGGIARRAFRVDATWKTVARI